MKRILGLAALSLLLFPPNVLAATWVKVATNNNKSITYIDSTSIVRSGSIINYWERVEFLTPISTGVSAYVTRETTSCEARIVRIDKLVGYNNFGEVIYNSSSEHSLATDLIVPDTTGEAVLKYVCSH